MTGFPFQPSAPGGVPMLTPTSARGVVNSPTFSLLEARRGVLAKIKRAMAAAAIENPYTAPNASGVTVTVGTADDPTLPVRRTAKSLWLQRQMAATGGTFYYSDSSERGVITSNNLAGDVGNLGGTLPNTVPPPPSQENAFGPSCFVFGVTTARLQIRIVAATAGLPIRVIVDGRYVDRVGYDVFGANGWLTLDFGGVRADHVIKIQTHGLNVLFYLNVDNETRLWNPTPPDAVRGRIWGDSHAEGAGNGSNPPIARWAANSPIYADLTGIYDYRIAAVRSSGYVHTGSSGVLRTVGQNIEAFAGVGGFYDIEEPAAGFNDAGKVYSQVYAAAEAAWRSLRAAQPYALIPVWGIWGAATGPSAGVVGLENGLKVRFAQWADPFSVFIPVSTASPPWETGTGREGAPNGTGNSDTYVGVDGIHATVAGHEYRAYRRAAALRDAVMNFVV